MTKLIVEFIGTFFLVLVIALVGDQPAAALFIGLGLTVLVYMGGPVSGAHFNPAVTLGVRLTGGMTNKEALRYAGAQMAGAVVATIAGRLIESETLTPAPGATWGPAYAVEFLFTFLLVLVVLCVAVSARSKGNQYFGVAIGLTVAAAAAAGGGISGGAFNPAVGLGPNLVAVFSGNAVPSGVWLLYLVGPLAGAFVAAKVFGMMEKA